jgi:hypothetical protein
MPQSAQKVAAWFTAHPTFKNRIAEDVLATAGPWPSLEVGDFLTWAREREDIPRYIIQLVEALSDELRWVYDEWTKSIAMDSHALLVDMFHNAVGDDRYNFTRQFLQDYAKAHGMMLEPPKDDTPPPWRVAGESGGQVPFVPKPLKQEQIEAGNVEPPQ